MNYSELITNLEYLTVSRLTAISKLYNIDCSTSNVFKLHKALNKVVNEGKRTEVKTTVDVEHDEIVDILKAIDEAMKAYKIKYGRSTFPKDMNIYQLIDDFRKTNIKLSVNNEGDKNSLKVDAKQMLKEIILDNSNKGNTNKAKKKTKRELVDEKKQLIISKMKLNGFSKHV